MKGKWELVKTCKESTNKFLLYIDALVLLPFMCGCTGAHFVTAESSLCHFVDTGCPGHHEETY